MKKLLSLLLIASFLIVFDSCQNEFFDPLDVETTELGIEKSKSTEEKDKKDYDKNIQKIAKSLAKSLKDKKLRKLIKDDAMLQLDGDYDIIWKDFKNKKVLTSKGEKRISDFIIDNDDNKGKSIKDKKKELENFGHKYKRLQIAVPVNCKNWDVENYHPIVTYIPSDYKEDCMELEAFDSKGKSIFIDAINPPDVPVIVVGQNERSDDEGNLYSSLKVARVLEDDFGEGNPPTPTNLTGSYSSIGNHLNWNYSHEGMVIIKIYRNSGSGYEYLDEVPSYSLDYLDSDVIAEHDYFYKLRAYDPYFQLYSTFYSNSVKITTSSYPATPSSFICENYAPNKFFLRWANPSGYTIGSIIRSRLYDQSSSSWSDWQVVNTVANSVDEYLDDLTIDGRSDSREYGQKVHYQIRSINNYGESKNGAYDVLYNPDRSNNTPFYLNTIDVQNLSDIEPWIKGNPEFKVTVATMNDIEKPYKLLDRSKINTSDRSGNYLVVKQLVSEWDNSFLKSIMSVNMIEYDDDLFVGKHTMKFPALKGSKNKVYGLINEISGGEIGIEIKNHDKELGTAYVRYHDAINKHVLMDYGVELGFGGAPGYGPRR